ncbi:hypothetical protein ACFVHS_25145 [Streptomyces sp. NPDC057746]|uniref:hypothetical protein n=1 Tax=Streptomyces sp. NPDC057746 TaxID=3346237 RepID=UPI0036AFD22B
MTTTTTEQRPDGPRIVGDALARAITGDWYGAGVLLVPLIGGGYGNAYGLAAMLAETASHIARRDQAEGEFFTMPVETVETGEPGSVDDLPPHVAFAAQFTTAWANRDQDTAEALFKALWERAGPSDGVELVDGLLFLFQMAVETSKAVTAEERAKRAGGGE